MTDAPQVLLAHHLKKLKLPTFQSEHAKLAWLGLIVSGLLTWCLHAAGSWPSLFRLLT